MSAESPRHARSGGPLTVPSQPPSDRSIIDAVSGFINDVTLSSSSTQDPKDVIQWARFETADINEPTPEGDSDNEVSPLLLILGYGAGVQVWLVPPAGEAQEVLSWRQGAVRVLRVLPAPPRHDCFAPKRPLIALCDAQGPGPAFCSLSFISVRGGEQVKSIKFKNPILDVLANKRSVVVSFSERFAVFDAATLEDRLAVTTCYPCPCPSGGALPINPLALGDRWLAYADKKLNPSKRSSGGCEGEGAHSYTATVLHAAKSLGKGLRGLGESVAHSLAGRGASQSPSPPHAELQQPGVVTVLDIEGNEDDDGQDSDEACDPIVAHFVAHSDAIIALQFDASGLLLVSADRRGHDFHVFRLHPHACGPGLASAHHLYVLHRGDTTAKVQDIAISCDSRWAAISTLRGTTHVFPISPYGGPCGVRTHTQPRVVNRLSRFHRSAGLPIHTAAHKRASNTMGDALPQGSWYPNPRLPPYPLPTTVTPLAQLRPTANIPTHTITRTSSGRQRLSSLSEDSNAAPLLARARFGAAVSARVPAPVAALYLMAANGSLLHLLLHPKPLSSIPKEKICDDSAIELEVEPVAQWPLQRPAAAADLLAPLPPSNPLLQPMTCRRCADACLSEEERWLSQVEIVTHAGPHRRLWMGPQFVFKTYNATGSNSSLSEAEAVEVDAGAARGVARSNPVNMPGAQPRVPVLVDSGSASSLEQSPSDSFRRKSLLADSGRAPSVCDVQLREDLAEAMKEDHGSARAERMVEREPERGAVERAVDPLGTVVQPARAPRPPEPELCARDNADEATFRPVRCAAAPLRAHAAPGPTRALPAGTTLPAQRAAPAPAPAPVAAPAVPLPTAVLIPAALEPLPPPSYADSSDEFNWKEPDPTPPASPRPSRSLPTENTVPVAFDAEPGERSSERVRESPPTESRKPRKSVDVWDRKHEELKTERSVKTEATKLEKFGRTKSTVDAVKVIKNVDIDIPSTAEIVEKPDKQKMAEVEIPPKIENISKIESSGKVEKMDKLECIKAEKGIKSESASRQSVPKETVAVVVPLVEGPSVTVSVKTPSKKKSSESKSSKMIDDSVRTEEQAWDMLLNEPEKPVLSCSPSTVDDKVEESKPKSKKNRKLKKPQEETQPKNEEDTFIEIHAIEEQKQSSGELVSISTPFEDIEPISYLTKTKKSRSSKSATPERKEFESKCDVWDMNEIEFTAAPTIHNNEDVTEIAFVSEVNVNINSAEVQIEEFKTNTLKVSEPVEVSCTKESSRNKKSKSLSPYADRKSTDKRYESEVKDVYVIDTIKDDFPEIQITKGKSRKKSPQPDKKLDIKSQEVEVVEKPIKSWSSIAASKTSKPEETIQQKVDLPPQIEEKNINIPEDTDTAGSSTMYLQEKLVQLCKRTDIMVAECDAPTELNFVEEHHSVLDLPPLEPLDFGLDDFKLEVMRDSLLDLNDPNITSPICKINIDNILSTIKETTSKAIESSAFNLIDLEKVPFKREKGFSIVENDKITSQEVKVDDDKDIEVMEKSSDDDNTSPVVSTDSDKEDKKPTGASSITLPSTKQLSKNKKSRKKKK